MRTKLLAFLLALLLSSCTVEPLTELVPGQITDRTNSDNASQKMALFLNHDNLHWVEAADGTIYWDENATSQGTTKPGETYLGANVLVGTHNRDANLNEPINSAKFELYLEQNKDGASATIMGNTVPADVSADCQTSGCGSNSRPLHNAFMNVVGTHFNGSYYLRPKP